MYSTGEREEHIQMNSNAPCSRSQLFLHWRFIDIYLSYTYLDMHVQDINIAKRNNIDFTQLGLLPPMAKSPSRGLIWLNKGWIKKWKMYSSANHKCLFYSWLALASQPQTSFYASLGLTADTSQSWAFPWVGETCCWSIKHDFMHTNDLFESLSFYLYIKIYI